MAKINKCTNFRSNEITLEMINTHFDEQNADGWCLVAVDNLVGWYRFFWEKEVSE